MEDRMAPYSSPFNETDLSILSNAQLIERVTQLEAKLREQAQEYSLPSVASSSKSPSSRRPKQPKSFDSSKYSNRQIALKFAYLGQNYNGLEHHANNDTPLPTVEEVLWKALHKAKLIFPIWNEKIQEGEMSWEGCEYSKCGRTDRGVSAFGQVVGLRVRSNRPLPEPPQASSVNGVAQSVDTGILHTDCSPASSLNAFANSGEDRSLRVAGDRPVFHPVKDELPYSQILNRLLPSDIRILAWCPNPPPDFSARFSCKERRYKYFFTNPAFAPTPSLPAPSTYGIPTEKRASTTGYLDISAMRTAASKFVGLHDFRNLCKVDPSKQLDNFERRIFHADIEEVYPSEQSAGYVSDPPFSPVHINNPSSSDCSHPTPRLYTFALHGSAFLWHQVRHMVAVLFLIGQGFESPSVIDELLDIEKSPRKPHYEMADDAPLVLWDCIFPSPTESDDHPTESRPDALEWIYVGDEVSNNDDVSDSRMDARAKGRKDLKYGTGGLVPDLWKVWRKRKMDEVLAGSLLNLAVRQGQGADRGGAIGQKEKEGENGSQKVYLGGDTWKLVGKYVPLMNRERMDGVEAVNERYRSKERGRSKKFGVAHEYIAEECNV